MVGWNRIGMRLRGTSVLAFRLLVLLLQGLLPLDKATPDHSEVFCRLFNELRGFGAVFQSVEHGIHLSFGVEVRANPCESDVSNTAESAVFRPHSFQFAPTDGMFSAASNTEMGWGTVLRVIGTFTRGIRMRRRSSWRLDAVEGSSCKWSGNLII